MAAGVTQQSPYENNDPYNIMEFVISQIIAGMATARIVKVMSVTAGAGDPPAPSVVDVQPMVNMLNGIGQPTEHGTIFGIPVARLQGGNVAVIIDPKVGDIGLMVCCDRDISTVKATKAVANPGSPGRRFSLSDGIYVMGLFGTVEPEAFLQFKDDGTIKLQDAHGNVLETGEDGFEVTTDGDFVVNGISVTEHIHSGVQPGVGNSGPPVP